MKQFISSTSVIICILFSTNMYAQNNKPTQIIRGVVIDNASGTPIPYVTVGLLDIPQKGTTTDNNGRFELKNVPVGRHDLQASYLGYEPTVFREIMLTSAKETYLEIQLKENVHQLDEIIVRPRINKEESLNKMALSGARMLSVEEANRYAGGMDDPARLVSSFAGVSSSVGNNGISVHGNAPSLLQWKLEDIEIPNPNHFADVASLGGGVLSSLSSNVLGNSDFYTSAFPAEYNNAVSGVFDMKLRNGNSQKFQHILQAGILGLDVASEGPLSKTSYLFNYRYSTTGLMNKVSPAGNLEQVLDYQDLNFKFNLPTEKAGVFSLWGTALIDKIKPNIKTPEEWDYIDDAKDSRMKQTSAAAGLSHRYFFKNNGVLKTTLATTYSKTDAWENIFDSSMDSSPFLDFKSHYTNLVLTSSFNKKYNSKHTNKTGFTFTHMKYDMDFDLAPFYTEPLEQISEGKGNTNLISGYTSSLLSFNDNLSATLGLNGQLLTLNNTWTIEPRAAIKWQASSKSSFGLAYGLHSRMEKMDVYFVSTFYVEDALKNKGKGRNYGVDVTFEKYMTKGLYYMVTASVFNSEYGGGDGVWHNTKFNRCYIINGLIGKEWMIGRNQQDVLSVNLKLTNQGGDRYSPINEAATLVYPDKETQYDETKAYSKQLSPIFLVNYTVSYRMNRNKISHEFAVKGMNATGYKEYFGHEYNLKTGFILSALLLL